MIMGLDVPTSGSALIGTAPQSGDLAARDGLRVHQLVPLTASLEDAFMELTQDEVEYRPSSPTGAAAAGERALSLTEPAPKAATGADKE